MFFWYLGVDCGFNWGLAGVKRIFSRIRIKFGFLGGRETWAGVKKFLSLTENNYTLGPKKILKQFYTYFSQIRKCFGWLGRGN